MQQAKNRNNERVCEKECVDLVEQECHLQESAKNSRNEHLKKSSGGKHVSLA
jgi:hypothetical protein